MLQRGSFGRLLVISPHLDDAVLGCGALLATHPRSVVLTVFAGAPRRPCRADWDAACGFADAVEAIAARRAEDAAALRVLEAAPHWLPFCDSQYEEPAAPAQVAAALVESIEAHRPDCVVLPLGLFHSDHRQAHACALLAWQALAGARAGIDCWLAYEDAMYRRFQGLLQERLVQLGRAGVVATPAECECERAAESALAAKRRAVQCYASQLKGLATPGRPGHRDAFAPERCWRLERGPRSRGRPLPPFFDTDPPGAHS